MESINNCLFVTILRPNRCTDFKEIWHDDTLILEEEQKLFTAITDYQVERVVVFVTASSHGGVGLFVGCVVWRLPHTT